jgi:UDP-GlcNAc:undecaprenyl-phosphate/decaprenyl-phosphate GlcNAc-1-phosphate transferase
MSWINVCTGFVVSALLGIIATRAAIAVALSYGIMSHPNRIVPQHRTAVAYLGGLAVAVGTAASLVVLQALRWMPTYPLPQPFLGLIVGSVLFLLLGLYDDLFSLRPAPKMVLQVSAAIIATLLGMAMLPGKTLAGFVLSCIWIVGMVNAANLTDVCDGLLTGLSLLAFLFFGLFGSGNRFIAIVLVGACFGFLVFNRPPARIFLGDAGSHLLGFLLAFFSMSEVSARNHFSTYAAVALISAVPLFEMTFLVVMRTRKRLPFWRGSPDHFSLRMQAAGLSRLQTDLIAWTFMALFCGIARALLLNPRWRQQLFLITAAAFVLTVCWWFLARHEVQREEPLPPEVPFCREIIAGRLFDRPAATGISSDAECKTEHQKPN